MKAGRKTSRNPLQIEIDNILNNNNHCIAMNKNRTKIRQKQKKFE